jgi:hypothetical protein
VLGHAAVHVSLILAEELAGPGHTEHRSASPISP